jgi:hypothetical protein
MDREREKTCREGRKRRNGTETGLRGEQGERKGKGKMHREGGRNETEDRGGGTGEGWM